MPNTPNVRFKGFADDWEQRKLETISDVRDGTHDSPAYQNEGHPFVTSKNVKDGFINYDDIQYISDEDFEEINKRSKVDVNDILMGMIGTIGNLALIRTKPDFAIKNVALIKDTKQVSYLYLYHYLQSKNVEKQLFSGMDGGTQKFVALKKIRELNILVPSEDEQLQISGFLENLDHLITLHQRKCDEVRQLKKFMLQKLFPKSGELIPEIRCAGFTDAWEQRKLGEVVTEVKRTDEKSDAPVMMITANEGFINQSERYSNNNAGQSLKKYIILEKGELAYNHGASKLRPYGSCFALTTEEKARIPFVYHCFATHTENAEFLSIVLNGKSTERQLRRIVSSGARMDGLLNISFEEYTSIDVILPSVVEQNQIVTCFRRLDHLITLHQQRCDKLKEVKRFMLQNMFPQKG